MSLLALGCFQSSCFVVVRSTTARRGLSIYFIFIFYFFAFLPHSIFCHTPPFFSAPFDVYHFVSASCCLPFRFVPSRACPLINVNKVCFVYVKRPFQYPARMRAEKNQNESKEEAEAHKGSNDQTSEVHQGTRKKGTVGSPTRYTVVAKDRQAQSRSEGEGHVGTKTSRTGARWTTQGHQ